VRNTNLLTYLLTYLLTSPYVGRGNVAELFPCSSCAEIKAKKPNAGSGDYVIVSGDGPTLEQASDLFTYHKF